MSVFSIEQRSIFERHGATVKQGREKRAGLRVTLPNGYGLSVQWGPCMYGSNYDSLHTEADESHLTASEAEIAVVKPGGGLVDWADGDNVQGWCSVERVQHVLDLLAADALLRDGVADDQWQEAAT